LQELRGLIEKGGDPGGFYESFVILLRNLLVWSLVKDRSVLVGEPSLEVIERLAGRFSVEQLTDLLQMFIEGEGALARSKNPRLVLETLLVRASFVPNMASLSALLKKIQSLDPVLHLVPQEEPRDGRGITTQIGEVEEVNGNTGNQRSIQEPSYGEKNLEGFLDYFGEKKPIIAEKLQILGDLRLEGATVVFQPTQNDMSHDSLIQGKNLKDIEGALEAYFERKLAFQVLRMPQSTQNNNKETTLSDADEKPLEFEEALSLMAELFKAEVLEDPKEQDDMLYEDS
jgi:DNA polymerase III gamma/tau subunit